MSFGNTLRALVFGALLSGPVVSAASVVTPLFAWYVDTDLLAAQSALLPPGPKVAIIIDDIGYSYRRDRPFVDFPAELTLAVIPFTPHGRRLSDAAHDQGKEVMLHAPMQTIGQVSWEPSLGVEMEQEELLTNLGAMIEDVPHIRGVNNHGGSLLTQDLDRMSWMMAVLSEQGLYFVDSKTTAKSVASEAASSQDLAHSVRDIFLDNERDPEAIRLQVNKLIAIALARGRAIGIGHPYPETLQVLTEELPQMQSIGVQIVPVSRYLEDDQNSTEWLKSHN